MLQNLSTFKKLNSKYKCNAIVSFRTIISKHEYNAMASFQTSANIGKTRDKYCLLSFMHSNKIGLLTPVAKINKRGSLNNVQGGGKKI